MPRKHRLTWQPGSGRRKGRWRIKYKGKVHYFPGGRGKTDREAYDAAVMQWESAKVKIDGETPSPHMEEYEKAIHDWELALAWSNTHDDPAMAEKAGDALQDLRARLARGAKQPILPRDRFGSQFEVPAVDLPDLLSSDHQARPSELAVTNGPYVDWLRSAPALDPLPPGDRKMVVPVGDLDFDSEKKIWADRLAVQERMKADASARLESHIGQFLKDQEKRAAARELSVGHVYAQQLRLRHFQDWLGKDIDVVKIDAKSLAAYRAVLLEKVAKNDWSRTTAGHYLRTVKSFVRWLWNNELIPALPRNLESRSQALQIGSPLKRVVTFTKDEIRLLLGKASGRTKLYVLLALNCAFTQKDIADLCDVEVDWNEGRIIRRRSKTGECENAPIVNYLLWPETFRSLKAERTDDSGDRVLLNSKGQPLWMEQSPEGGKYRKNDNIKNAFDRLKKSSKTDKPFKSLKKTSATMLRNDVRFASLESLFLGHAPQSMSDRHYTQAPQGLLDQAILWLGQEYGVVPAESTAPEADKPGT